MPFFINEAAGMIDASITYRIKYNLILETKDSIFQEFCMIVESIKNDFQEEKKQDPELTMQIVDRNLDLVREYHRSYHNRPESNWNLERDLNYTRQNIRSFHREFDNPFLRSQRWYQRITKLQEQLSEQARELDKLIEH